MVEGRDGGLLRVGDHAVDGLLAVDVGLVLKVAAEGIAGRLQHETGDREGEQQHQKALAAGQRIPVYLAELPARARSGAASQPANPAQAQ